MCEIDSIMSLADQLLLSDAGAAHACSENLLCWAQGWKAEDVAAYGSTLPSLDKIFAVSFENEVARSRLRALDDLPPTDFSV